MIRGTSESAFAVSGRRSWESARLGCTTSGLTHCSKNAFYSISSSARATSIGGERERELIDRLAPPAPIRVLTNSSIPSCIWARGL